MSSASHHNSPARLKLLVADDDAVIVEYVAGMLAADGHEVHTAANGRQALDIALARQPQMVITDWVMPQMDGLTLCRALRETVPGRRMYLLVMTDFEDVGRAGEAFDAGADDFVQKPLNAKKLAARLRAAQRVLKLHAAFDRDDEELRQLAAVI